MAASNDQYMLNDHQITEITPLTSEDYTSLNTEFLPKRCTFNHNDSLLIKAGRFKIKPRSKDSGSGSLTYIVMISDDPDIKPFDNEL